MNKQESLRIMVAVAVFGPIALMKTIILLKTNICLKKHSPTDSKQIISECTN